MKNCPFLAKVLYIKATLYIRNGISMKTTISIITFILVLVGHTSLVFAQDNTQVGLPDMVLLRDLVKAGST